MRRPSACETTAGSRRASSRSGADRSTRLSRWYPTSSIKSDPDAYRKFIASLPADQTIVFYCASGVRSGKAADLASEQGRKAANLGGFKDWQGAGLPVTAPAKALQPG